MKDYLSTFYDYKRDVQWELIHRAKNWKEARSDARYYARQEKMKYMNTKVFIF